MNTFLKLASPKKNIVYLEGIVKGLVSESKRVEKRLESIDFDVGGLPVSIEELNAMEILLRDVIEDREFGMSVPEKAYANNLKRFGEVRIPPPSYITFIKFCRDGDVKVNPIDMDDEHYTMAYCKHVSGTNWIMQSLREKRLLKRKLPAETPVDFAILWDKEVNKLKGYRKLERHREKVMGKNIYRLSKKGILFSLLEVERLKGVIANLRSLGFQIIEDKD